MLADSPKRTSVTLGHSESQRQESPNFIKQLATSALPGAVLPAQVGHQPARDAGTPKGRRNRGIWIRAGRWESLVLKGRETTLPCACHRLPVCPQPPECQIFLWVFAFGYKNFSFVHESVLNSESRVIGHISISHQLFVTRGLFCNKQGNVLQRISLQENFPL